MNEFDQSSKKINKGIKKVSACLPWVETHIEGTTIMVGPRGRPIYKKGI